MSLTRSFAVVLATFVLISTSLAADWPQWRGPQRSGIAASGPAIAEAWDAKGPAKLWESEKIPSGGEGGLGSVVVSDGRVYLFATPKFSEPIQTRVLSEDRLRGLGWSDVKLPDELRDAVEEARVSEARTALKGKDKPLQDWINQWVKERLPDAEQRKKLGGVVRDRLNRGSAALPFETLDKLAEIKGKMFENPEALNHWLDEAALPAETRKQVLEAIPTTRSYMKDTIFCLDVSTGKTLWKKEFPGSVYDWGSSCTPCVVAGKCYVMGSKDKVYCRDAKTGEEVWTATVKDGDKNASFIVVDGLAIVLAGELTAFDAKTGAVAWKQSKVAGTNNSPVVWTCDGRTILLCNTESHAAAVDAKTGDILWTVPGGGWSTAAVAGDRMVILGGNNKVGLTCYRLAPERAEKAWMIADCTDRGASPLILGDYVYAVHSGELLCVKLEDGAPAWRQKGSFSELGSPVAVGDKVFVLGGEGGGLMMVRATPEKYTLLGKAPWRIAQCATPAVVNGKLFIRLAETVACFDLTATASKPSE